MAPGWESAPALSPDGGLIAYSSDESGNADIWIVDVRGGNAIRLTDDPASDTDPAWFPDGSALAFTSDRGGSTAIWKVLRLGGAPSLLVPDADGRGPLARWEPDRLRSACGHQEPHLDRSPGRPRPSESTHGRRVTDSGTTAIRPSRRTAGRSATTGNATSGWFRFLAREPRD